MARYHLVRSALGGSDVFDSDGNQVGYSLPSILGDGEDFYDMDGNPVGQSFESAFGGEYFSGPGAAGFMDKELVMGRNVYLNGDPFEKEEEPDLLDFGGGIDSQDNPPFGDMPEDDFGDDGFPPDDSFADI